MSSIEEWFRYVLPLAVAGLLAVRMRHHTVLFGVLSWLAYLGLASLLQLAQFYLFGFPGFIGSSANWRYSPWTSLLLGMAAATPMLWRIRTELERTTPK